MAMMVTDQQSRSCGHKYIREHPVENGCADRHMLMELQSFS
jgi:hypothetical protein